jgi:hypothetical protein
MSKKFAIVVFVLLMFCALQGWAGTSGNGWVQPKVTKYVFCYAGNPKVVYFTQVVTVAPSATDLGDVEYAHYIQKTYGLPAIDRMRCVPANSNADAVTEKQRYKEMLGKTKFIDIKWEGNSAFAH